MSEPVSIIVYSSPAEAAFWESGIAFPLFASLFIGFVVGYIAAKIWEAIGEVRIDTKYFSFHGGRYKTPFQKLQGFNKSEMTVFVVAFLLTAAYTLYRFGVF